MWNYSEHSAYNNCDITYTPVSGEVGILQTDSTFLIVGEDYSATGTVNGSSYTFSDTWCEHAGSVTENVSITLTSATSGSGTVSWTYSETGYSCSGGHQFSITKQSQADPVYDASGTWDFVQYNFYSSCGSVSSPSPSGHLEVTQTGSKITAVDDLGNAYNGFVNGAEYAVVRSYLQNGGRTSEWGIITLSSNTEGSGKVGFVWDDSCDDCYGEWDISISKQVYTISASTTAGGTISPSGEVSVNAGANQTFQITPSAGYRVLDVKVDGASIGAKRSYTFYSISSNHTITAIFSLKSAALVPIIPLLLED